MDKYERISVLLDDMENLLDSIILSGTALVREETERELKDIEEYCRKIGLQYGGELVSRLQKALAEKRHRLKSEDTGIVECCCLLGAYVQAVKSKIRLDNIGNNLMRENLAISNFYD